MELLDIVRAIRRYWALTAAVVVLFLLLGVLATLGRGQSYEASALVVVSFAESDGFGAPSTDRYVQNQLVVFQSSMLAAEAAEELDGLSTEQVQAITDFEQVDGSDIIRVIARSGSAEQSREVANSYAAAYVDVTRQQILESSRPQIEAIDAELEAIADDLNQLPSAGDVTNPLAANVNQERAQLRARQTELSQLREELVLARNQAQASNRILQEAELPGPSGNPTLLLAAALFVGSTAGAVAAAGYARLTGRVLDGEEIAETLGVPPAATLPALPKKLRGENVLAHPPDWAAVRGLCVRIEGQTLGDTLVIAVAGTDSVSGTTTAAVAISAQYGRQGFDTLLVDLDVMNPELSRLAGTGDGVAAFLDGSGQVTSIDLAIPGVRFTGVGSSPTRLPRESVEELVKALAHSARVVVIDCGTLLDSAASRRIVELADAAVLAVPIKRQRSTDLAVIAQDLRPRDNALLPVVTSVARR